AMLRTGRRTAFAVPSRCSARTYVDIVDSERLSIARLPADARVPAHLQVHHRRQRPEIDLDIGQHHPRLDLLAEERLTAHAEVDARLLQFVNQRDVRVVAA